MFIRKCTLADFAELTRVWEDSVSSSHDFLSPQDIAEIKLQLPTVYLPSVELYAAIAGTELDDNGTISGFIGLSADKIEMLFVSPDFQGKGAGSALIDLAVGRGIKLVDVNEQNPAALAFYLRKGFRIIGRQEHDDAGRPFPILHLAMPNNNLM